MSYFFAVFDVNIAGRVGDDLLSHEIVSVGVGDIVPDNMNGGGRISVAIDADKLALVIGKFVGEVGDYIGIRVLRGVVEGVLEIAMLTTACAILSCHDRGDIGGGIGGIVVEVGLSVEIVIACATLKG